MNIFKHGIHLKKKTKSRLLERMRFSIVGGIGVSAGYVVLYSLTEFAHIWYILSSIFASILNCWIDFILQKYWAFHNPDKKHLRQQLKAYVFIYFLLFIINTIFLYILVEHIHIYYIIAQIFLTFILSIISYITTRAIFRK